MTDILGPASADKAVTSRPSETRSFGDADSWFRDCTSPSSDDGTETEAAWFNQVTGVLRLLARMNGTKSDGVTPVVSYDQSDGMVLRAVQHLVQRNRLNVAYDKGGGTAAVVTLLQTPAEILPGMRLSVKMVAAADPNTTLTVTGFGSDAIRHNGGSALIGGEWAVNDWVEFKRADGTWQLTGLTLPETGSVCFAINSARNGDAYTAASTVPKLSALRDGQVVVFYNTLGTNTSTSPTISIGGFPPAKVIRQDASVAPGDIRNGPFLLEYDAGQNQFHILGTTAGEIADLVAANAPKFPAGTITGNGWWRDPNTGFTIQWGQATLQAGASDVQFITFPRAFSSFFAANCTDNGAYTWSTSNASIIGVASPGQTGFTAYGVNSNGGAFNRNTMIFFGWIAIGLS